MANFINRTTNPDNPTFRIRISLGKNLLTGKYDYFTKTFKGTEESAKDYAKNKEIELKKERVSSNLIINFNELAEKFLLLKKNDVRQSVYTGYVNDIKHLKNLNQISINDVKPSQIRKILKDMINSGLSSTTAYRTFMAGKMIMELGKNIGLIIKNPFDSVEKPKKVKIKRIPVSKASVDKILSFFKNEKIKIKVNGITKYYINWGYVASMLAVHTDAVRGEIMGLKWEDLDLENHIITFKRNITDIGVFSINDYKYKSNYKKIRAPKQLVELLINYRHELNDNLKRVENISLKKSHWVFYNPHSKLKVFLPNAITHKWSKALKKCNLNNLKFNDLKNYKYQK